MDYHLLKTAIAEVIKANGNNEITGDLLQAILLTMVGSLGSGCQFAGVVDAATIPQNTDSKIFYLAGEGTYPNFNGMTIGKGEIGVFFNSGGGWYKQTILLNVAGGLVNADPTIPQYNILPAVPASKQDAYVWVYRTYDNINQIHYTLYRSIDGGAWTSVFTFRLNCTQSERSQINNARIPPMVSKGFLDNYIKSALDGRFLTLDMNFPNNIPGSMTGTMQEFDYLFHDQPWQGLLRIGTSYNLVRLRLLNRDMDEGNVALWNLNYFEKTVDTYFFVFGGYGTNIGSSFDIEITNLQYDQDDELTDFDFELTFNEM